MKPRLPATVSALLLFFACHLPAVAQIGANTGANTGASQERDFGGGAALEIDAEPLEDQRDFSINEGTFDATAGRGGAGGAFGGNNQLQGLFQALGGQGGQLGNQFGPQGSQQQFKSRVVRAPFRIDFELPTNSVSRNSIEQIAERAADSFSRLPRFAGNSIQVTAGTGRTVVLSGTVKRDADRELAERVARLAPGVTQVDNQIVVAEN